VADFGVFVLVEEGLEGLLHISEMDGASGETQAPVVSKGASIKAQVIYVSERKRRLALTLCDDDTS
jgi:small subunit ribosomal protein S1